MTGRPGVFTTVALCLLAAAGVADAQPSAVTAPALAVGDAWVFDRTHQKGTKVVSQKRVELRIERVGEDSVMVGVRPADSAAPYKDHLAAPDWAQSRVIDGQQVVVGRPFRFPLSEGETWTVEWRDPASLGAQSKTHWRETYKVVGWTDVATPAGNFHTIEIEMNGLAEAEISVPRMESESTNKLHSGQADATVRRTQKFSPQEIHNKLYGEFYYAPQTKYFVKSLQEQYNSDNVLTARDTETLVSFKPARATPAS